MIGELRSIARGAVMRFRFHFRAWDHVLRDNRFLRVLHYISPSAPTIVLVSSNDGKLFNARWLFPDCNLLILSKTRRGAFARSATDVLRYLPSMRVGFRDPDDIPVLFDQAGFCPPHFLLFRSHATFLRSPRVDGYDIAIPPTIRGAANKWDESSYREISVTGTGSPSERLSLAGGAKLLVVGSMFQSAANNVDTELLEIARSSHPRADIVYMPNPMRLVDLTIQRALDDRLLTTSFEGLLRVRDGVAAALTADPLMELVVRAVGIPVRQLDAPASSGIAKFSGWRVLSGPTLDATNRKQLSEEEVAARLELGSSDGTYQFAPDTACVFPGQPLVGLAEDYDAGRLHGASAREFHVQLAQALSKQRLRPSFRSASLRLIERLLEKAAESGDAELFIECLKDPEICAEISTKFFIRHFDALARHPGAAFSVTGLQQLRNARPDANEIAALAVCLVNASRPHAAKILSENIPWSTVRSSKSIVILVSAMLDLSHHSTMVPPEAGRGLAELLERPTLWQDIFPLRPAYLGKLAVERTSSSFLEHIRHVSVVSTEGRSQSREGDIETLFAAAAKYPVTNSMLDILADMAISRARIAAAIRLLRGKYRASPDLIGPYVVQRVTALLLAGGREKAAIKILRWGCLRGFETCASPLNAALFRRGELKADLAGAVAAPDISPAEYRRIAEGLLILGQPEKASEFLIRAINEKEIKRRDIVVPLTQALLRQDRFENVVAWYDGVGADSLTPEMADVLSSALIALGRKHQAAEVLENTLEKHPRSVALALRAGEQSLTLGRYIEAARHFELVLKRSPLHPTALSNWARCLILQGVAYSEIARFENEMQAAVLEAHRLCWLATLLAAVGRMAEAAGVAFRAAELEPGNREVVNIAAGLFHQIGDEARLDEVLTKFNASAPPLARNLRYAAERYLFYNKMPEAKAAALRAVGESPSDPLCHFVLGRVLFTLGELELAAKAFRKSLCLNPTLHRAAGQLARVYLQQGDIQAAMRQVDEAIALSMSGMSAIDPNMLAIKAEIADHRSDFGLARQHYELTNAELEKQGKAPNMRVAWSAGLVSAAEGDLVGQAENVALISKAVHATLPPNIPIWKGEPVAGKKVALIMRGGPGDELRAMHSALRYLTDQGCELTVVGDGRLESIFEVNFARAKFIVNPKAGRRLAPVNGPIDPDIVNSLLPLTIETWSRLHSYIPADILDEHDFIAFSDDLWLYSYFLKAHEISASEHQCALTLPSGPQTSLAEYMDSFDPGSFKVGISWRGSYFSPNRPQQAFMNVADLRAIFAIEGVDYIDLHPNVFDEEIALLQQAYDPRLSRPNDIDLMNDFESLGNLVQRLDLVVVPPNTQRDFAAALGHENIFSFGLVPGAYETWRVDPQTRRDRLQSSIRHFTLSQYGSRDGVVEALATAIRNARDEWRKSERSSNGRISVA